MTQRGPLPNWLSPVSHMAAAAYGAAVRARSRRFDRAGAAARAAIPVISVGNVTVGGTGKTPFVRWCVQALTEAGHRPMVALRGYKSRKGFSDEAMEYRELLPGITVAMGANRAAALGRAVAADAGIDCAVLDDAFQHRRLQRDLDIVLVDATRPGLEGALLPAGWLREPAGALRRAGLVVVTRAQREIPELAALIGQHHGRAPAAWCHHHWSQLDVFQIRNGSLSGLSVHPVGWLKGRSVVAVVAIANPGPFVAGLAEAGAQVAHQLLRHDHASYGPAEGRQILALAASRGGVVATTWKDWTKLRHALVSVGHGCALTVVVPRVSIQFASGEAVVKNALAAAAALRR